MHSPPPITLEYVPCDLCGSFDHEPLYRKTDPVTGMEFGLVGCRCGMAFVNPMPIPESIPLLYPADYLAGKEFRRDQYDRMLRLLPQDTKGTLLDIGCGRGDFIEHAARSGWNPEGVDLMDWNSLYEVPIRIGDFLTVDLPEGAYDVATAWALLEHVRKPSLFFEKISRLLRTGGLFIFVVPNVSALGMRHSCAEDVPRHLWLFTPDAVKRYLGLYGMEAVSVLHSSKIYRAYPFGLLRYWFGRSGNSKCADYENRSVALLRNRQIKGNLRTWISEVVHSVGTADLVLDAIDLVLGLCLARISLIIRNYGIITVIASKKG